jgi:hypothetical protein
MEVKISSVVLWVMMSCSLVCGYQQFGGTCHLNTLKMVEIHSSEMLVTTYETRSHGVTNLQHYNQLLERDKFKDRAVQGSVI